MNKTAIILISVLCSSAWAGNIFTEDVNCVGLWTMEDLDATDTADYSGNGNTLVNSASNVDPNTSIIKEGATSAYWADNAAAELQCFDRNLSTNFPGKEGFSNTTVSACAWFRIETINSYANICGKIEVSKESWAIWVYSSGGPNVHLNIGNELGQGSESITHSGTTVAVNQWYHVGITYDGPTKAYRIRVWDETGGSATETTGTATNAMNIENGTFGVMNQNVGDSTPGDSWALRGYIDEVVVFNDVLTADEIDQIRGGTYGAATGTSDWWWRRRHNN